MSPKVSINLCCYNSEKYLRETLDSIVNQTYKDWELVIINDGSSDSTESIINEYINQGYLIIYHYQQNKGLGYSRNEALKRSQGEFIAFMDHDDLWMPGKLEKQIPLFYKDTQIGIVACNAIQFNNENFEALFCKRKPTTGYVFREMLGNYRICFPSAVIRRSALDGLDEWFDARFNHVLDSDLFMRIVYTWHFDYVDEPLARNRIHKGSSSYLRPDLSPKETEMMLAKFIKIFPNFEAQYKKEIFHMRFYIQYYYALSEWRQGKNFLVRKRLRPFLANKLRAMVPFLLSVFPYRYYETVLRCFNNYIRRIPMA